MHITLQWAVEQFAAGQVAAAHPPCLLEHPQIPINSRQAHALAQFAAQFVQLLAAQLFAAGLKDPEDLPLAVAEPLRHATAENAPTLRAVINNPIRLGLPVGGVAGILPGFHLPAPAAAAIALMQQGIHLLPNPMGAAFHAHIAHHAQIQGAELMQPLPLAQQGVIAIGQKGVVELMVQLFPQFFEAGEIHHEPVGIQFAGPKPAGEAAAVAMHKSAMAPVVRLAVAAGESFEAFGAGVHRAAAALQS